jgi:cellobiose phosphorylase
LDEPVPFLEGYAVNPNDESYYDLPGRSEEKESLYQHCVRAINKGLKFGKHGIPLIGTGDWNDGMNRVGNEGKGESVWLGFFLYDVLMQFTRISGIHGDAGFAQVCTDEANKIRANLIKNWWDGEWYLRAGFDNGTPLGASEYADCL